MQMNKSHVQNLKTHYAALYTNREEPSSQLSFCVQCGEIIIMYFSCAPFLFTLGLQVQNAAQ